MIKELMSRVKNICRFVIYNGIKFSFFSALMYCVYRVLERADFFKGLKMDIIPRFSISDYIFFVGCICAFLVVLIFIESKILWIDIAFKRYTNISTILLYLSQIMVWIKSNDYQNKGIYFGEILVIYLIEKYFSIKQQKYIFIKNDNVKALFSEQPIVGREYLTNVQKEALNKLVQVIDDRKASESINIALLAAWGRGKSSVTDTMIDLLQKRKKQNCKYFILKINMLTMTKTSSLVEYVQEYFYSLFKMYSIKGIGGRENVTFLSTLSDLLDDSKTVNLFKYAISERNKSSFVDLELEREVFTYQVEKLLKYSGRKNIIFVIDDADRSEIKDKMIQLLAEFSSINGIICVVSLDEKSDIQYKPSLDESKDKKKWNSSIYDEIDKYIHLRIRLEHENHVENETCIREELISEYLEIDELEDTLKYIECLDDKKVPSIFDAVRDYPTHFRVENINRVDNTSGILQTLFFENFISSGKSFGKYLEDLLTNYFMNCKEFHMYIPKVKYTNIEQWDSELMQTYFSWFGYKFFGDEKMDWINHVMSRANQILFTMCNLYNGIDLMNKNKETKLYQDLHSIYVYSMKNLFPFSDSEMHGENVVFSNFQSDIKELLDKNEQNKLLNLVNNRNYPECRKLLKDKIEKSAHFYALIIQLNDFILDLRNILNNYRTFKIQLREARVLKLNYI